MPGADERATHTRSRGPGIWWPDVAIGLTDAAVTVADRAARPLLHLAGRGLGSRLLSPAVRPLAERGRRVRQAARHGVGERSDAVLPAVVEALVSRVDLTTLVHEHVDLDGLAATMDVDAIARRLDLIGLANYVIDGVDLPEIIRQSSASVTSDAVREVRMHGIEADQAVARMVDRLLPRRHGRDAGARSDGDVPGRP